MRLTQFWERMDRQFGASYSRSVAKDHVLAELGGRTIDQAFADGESAKRIWAAVVASFDVPYDLR